MWTTRQTAIGRIVVPPNVPKGYAVFCTTIDFDGALSGGGADALTRVIHDQFGLPTSLTTCRQIHSATAERAGDGEAWREVIPATPSGPIAGKSLSASRSPTACHSPSSIPNME